MKHGTIKRYLDDLVSKDFVRLTRKVQINMVFFLNITVRQQNHSLSI
jgi:hypothetical protein